ncbi:NAD-glutamate dehydrogenase [Spartinivicinus ruber]|uniref:NAD-glutamate dehydrogenase n=1 Tax=Spartinivicinus ruber TaxID=2683272 RepID=UPI0013CF7140|nr:NAD-glutamate dehydrogenase [Spartinivicinus ruber]
MSSVTTKKQDTIAKVVAVIQERLPSHTQPAAIEFAKQFLAESITKEIIKLPFEGLSSSVLSLWDYLQHKAPGAPLIRAFNPTFEDHGWESRHTIVEIITDDMPFLVSSISMALNRLNCSIEIITHPVIAISRSSEGELQTVLPRRDTAITTTEAVMRFEIERESDESKLAEIVEQIHQTLSDVRQAVTDWPAMVDKLKEAIQSTEQAQLPVSAEDLAEELDFLHWVAAHHFTFLGFRAYQLSCDPQDGSCSLTLDTASSLGTFRSLGEDTPKVLKLSPYMAERLLEPSLLVLTKSISRSTVHRPAHLDYIGIKRYDQTGKVIGEWRFFGLYSSTAYTTPYSEIPLLRRKAAQILDKANIPLNSHKGKTLRNILNHYPRDEMMQANFQQLEDTVLGILETQERRQLRAFIRPDIYGRFITAIVYVPRDRYNTELRVKMQNLLLKIFNGHSVEFNVQFSEQISARVQFTIHCENAQEIQYNTEEIESQMTRAMLSWVDNVKIALREKLGEAEANRIYKSYQQAFPAAYRDDFATTQALVDILRIEQLDDNHPLSTYLYRPQGSFGNLHFKVIGRGQTLALSDVLPILEQMGVRVLSARPYTITPQEHEPAWIIDFDIATDSAVDLDVPSCKDEFQDTFVKAYTGAIENDGFNKLVVAAGLKCRKAVMLRAVCKYLLQIKVPFSQAYMEQTLARNAVITRLLAELFSWKFDPYHQDEERATRIEQLQNNIEQSLSSVSNLDEDRILRHYLSVIQAMQRTNYYQLGNDHLPKNYLSFKLKPKKIPIAPQPRPMFEIFVYSPWVEGVHMRGGKVARGGLRWSDRKEDFRTEILGLVKAQMVKNAVIVPAGAKGGFVAKQLPEATDRDTIQQEVIRCYTTFISGLLDITDNLVHNQVTPPNRVIRHDPDDPYLVVAADKGTATFSDIANQIANDYGFWLGDAFASGGSNGYDHKKMGITARGAWESVKRLFLEQGLNTQQQDFTCVGIGDMGGDVFGNGMLLSEHIRLVAAFNHMHIFIDPNPSATSSFAERQRLFKQPRSSWMDYDQSLLSKGGGIFERSAKQLTISAEAQQALGVKKSTLTPNELIKAILKAPVDLLWNGGIGTYAKASAETDTDVGDRANDALRVNANQLRCKVIGEGGNLGLTQLARVEFAQYGGFITTDAIDNSAGVDSSDHEVNIKIAISQVVENGDMTIKQRNQLLAEMTDEVAELVLKHNYQQSQILSITNQFATELLPEHTQLIHQLEKQKRLKRKLEFLPNDEQIAERQQNHQGFYRPEQSVLLAYSKINLHDELVASDISADKDLRQILMEYFPKPLVTQCKQALGSHPLKSEIIATHLTNLMVNRMGPTFCLRVQEQINSSSADIVRAYMAANAILKLDNLWRAVDSLQTSLSHPVLNDLFQGLQEVAEKVTVWLLRHESWPMPINKVVEKYREPLNNVVEILPKVLIGSNSKHFSQLLNHYTESGVPADLASSLATSRYLYNGLDIVAVALMQGEQVNTVASLYFALDNQLNLSWFRQSINALPQRNLWQRKARITLADELELALRQVCVQLILQTDAVTKPSERLNCWHNTNVARLKHSQSLVTEMQAATQQDLAMLSVAVKEIRRLT